MTQLPIGTHRPATL